MKKYKFNVRAILGLMAENHLTKKDMAVILGISEVQALRKFAERAPFRIDELITICETFGETPDRFFETIELKETPAKKAAKE